MVSSKDMVLVEVVVVIVLLCLSLIVLQYLTEYLLSDFSKPPPQVEVVDVVPFKAVVPEWRCSLEYNFTHVVERCWAVRQIYGLILRGGVELRINELSRIYGVTAFNHSVVRVVDLVNMIYAEQEMYVFLERRGLGNVYVVTSKISPVIKSRQESFNFTWVDVYEVHRVSGLGINAYGDGGFTLYLAVFIYFSSNETLVEAPPNLVEAVANVIRTFYAKPLEVVTGLPLKVTPVDASEYCKWGRYVRPSVEILNNVSCSSINGREVVKVVIVVTDDISTWQYPAAAESRSFYLVTRNTPTSVNDIPTSTLLHEFGHVLGLKDLYVHGYRDFNEVIWALTADRHSIMDNPEGFKCMSLLDLASLAGAVWMELSRENSELARYVGGRLLTYGINVSWSGVYVLVPVTRDGAPLKIFKELISRGVMEVRYNASKDTEEVVEHMEVLEVMNTLYNAYRGHFTLQ